MKKLILSGLIFLNQLYFLFSLSCSEYKPEKIKLVTFDVYAALMNTLTSLERNARNIIPGTVENSKVDEFMECWVGFYSKAMYADPSNYKEPFEDFLIQGIDQCSLTLKLRSFITKEIKDGLILAWTRLDPWEGTEETLYKLKENNIKLGILSNGSVKSLTLLLKNSLPKIHFDYIFGSTKPKRFKPHPDMYKQVDSTGLSRNEILHIAGADMDVEGARSFGLFAGFNSKASGTDAIFEKEKPCFIISNIRELPRYLKKIF